MSHFHFCFYLKSLPLGLRDMLIGGEGVWGEMPHFYSYFYLKKFLPGLDDVLREGEGLMGEISHFHFYLKNLPLGLGHCRGMMWGEEKFHTHFHLYIFIWNTFVKYSSLPIILCQGSCCCFFFIFIFVYITNDQAARA